MRVPTATVKITSKRVDHNDREAAGWARGFWWVLELPDHPETPVIESGAPTRQDAENAAREAAASRGYFEVNVL